MESKDTPESGQEQSPSGVKESQLGTLFLVAMPIGNRDDITVRALKVLKAVDVIVCEDPKETAPILLHHGISKPLEVLNEHNELRKTEEVLGYLRAAKKVALVSDAGTPVVADPGFELVQRARQLGAEVVPVPGPSAIMTAVMMCGLPVDQFLYAGFLSRIPAIRKSQLEELAQEPRTVVILETPYRLLPLLRTAAEVIPDRPAYVGCNLTMPSETHHYGTVKELLAKFEQLRFKGEFVFCFAGLPQHDLPDAESRKPQQRSHKGRKRSKGRKGKRRR